MSSNQSSSSSSSSTTTTEIPKIKKIEKRRLEPEEAEVNQKSTKKSSLLSNTPLPQKDYLSIYNNKTILFLGDNSIRILYRDFIKMLSCGRLLEYTEATCCNGHYKTIECEALVVSDGTLATDEYRNIRKFFLPDASIMVIFIYLATIFDPKSVQQLDYLKDINIEKSLDVIVFSSYSSDINHKKISNCGTSFNNYLNSYMIEFEKFVDYLKSLCENKDNSNQLFYWITPIPNNTTMSPENKNEFEKIIKDTNNIITSSGYNIFDRYDLWRRRADLVVTKSGHFSLHGVREINDWLGRDVANKWHKTFTSSIPPPSSKLAPLTTTFNE